MFPIWLKMIRIHEKAAMYIDIDIDLYIYIYTNDTNIISKNN